MSVGTMDSGEPIWHGGDLATARALFPQAPEPGIDLSPGINPPAWPLPAIAAAAWTRLPGRRVEEALLAAARGRYRVPADQAIVAAPGTQALIEWLPRVVAARHVAILGPTYAEHAHAWRKAGVAVAEVTTMAEAEDADVIVVVNPNNPDGRILSADMLALAAARLAARGGLLIVDDSFADFAPDASVVPLGLSATLVLRSFGKTYCLAGIRLGFAIGGPAMVGRLREALGPWAVSGPALAVGAAALADGAWLARQRGDRARDAARLDALMAPHAHLVGGTVLYRLYASDRAASLFAAFGRAGIFVRRFQHDARLLRLGLPPDETAFARLAAALERLAREAA